MTLPFTGERFTTDCQGEMVYEHWHRYLIARDQVAGKVVLDIGSGEGYGSHLLSGAAQSVVGVDLSTEAVNHATGKYASSNLRYVTASCTQIPLPSQSFDVIVSFEMIEHIHEQAEFIAEVNRLLKPDGLFIVSSPNRPEYSEKTGYNNEFHVKELDRAELKALLDPHWPAQKWFAQRAAFHSMVWPLDAAVDSGRALAPDGSSAYPAEVYFIVMCSTSAASVAALPSQLTLVADRENSVYSEWSRTYQENASLHRQIAELTAASAEHTPHTSPQSPADTSASAAPLEPWLVRFARRLTGG
ncbi:MAG: class I SAM-dependent methyltransferase [Betaproteobacteria bacterium]|nr:MAG: class I SAM-dependent methyltransferase [Betaproteobacteria bacterium]